MDTLIAFGSEIKSFEETADAYRFEGELVVFGSRDQSGHRDKFTKSTEFYLDDGESRPVIYHHGLDGTLGKARLGSGRLFIRDAGVWVRGEIKKRSDYLARHVDELAAQMGRSVTVKGQAFAPFGLSSGAASHLVERIADSEGHEILSWPISEISITPTPAERLTSCGAIKSLDELDLDYHFDFNFNSKAGRTLSATNHGRIASCVARIRDGLDDLDALLEQHDPEALPPSTVTDIQKAMRDYVVTQTAFNGVHLTL